LLCLSGRFFVLFLLFLIPFITFSILLELGYLNNPDDNKLIESTEYQENIAKSIASALKEYFQQ